MEECEREYKDEENQLITHSVEHFLNPPASVKTSTGLLINVINEQIAPIKRLEYQT